MAPPAKDPYEELSEEASADPYAAFAEPEPQAVAPDSIPQRLTEWAGIINRAAAPYAIAGAIPVVGPAALAATDFAASLYNLGAEALGGRRIMTGSQAIQAALPETLFPYREPRTKAQRIASSAIEAGIGAKSTANALRSLATMAQPGQLQNVLRELGTNQTAQAAAAAGAVAVPGIAEEYFDVENPAIKTALGIVGGVTGAGASRRLTQTKPPTTAELKESAGKAYKEVENAQIVFAPQSYDALVGRINQRLTDEAYNPRAETPMKNVVAALNEKKGRPLDYKDFEKLRVIARDAAKSPDASTRRLSKLVVKELDNYVSNAKANDIVSGDLPKMQLAIFEARQNYAAAMRGADIEEAIRKAKLTGGGVADYQREFRALRNNTKKMRGFTPDQVRAIEKTAQVGGYIDILDSIGEASPLSRTKGVLPINLGALGAAYAIDPTSQSALSPERLAQVALATTSARIAANQLIARRARIAGDIARGGYGRNALTPAQIAFPTGVSMLERERAPVNFLMEQQRLAEQGF